MNKDTKKLPHAIKMVIEAYGKNIVNDVRTMNIMNDMVSLDETPAIKTILRDVLKLGYGKKLLAISTNDDYHLKVKAFSNEVSDKYGYREVLAQYVLYSIAYGIGVCPHAPSLTSRSTPKTTPTHKVVSNNKPKNTINTKPKRASSNKSIIVSLVISLFVIGYGIMYLSSATDRQQFKETLFTGDTFMNNGDYGNALESYKDAYNGYNAMNSSSYKEEALNKMDEMTDRLFSEGKTNNNSLLQAYQLTKSEMELNLEREDQDRIEIRLNDIEALIAEKIDNGRNTLILNLSANNGKLDENSKKLLLELLALSPDDYWLNFIKKKSYE